MKLHRFKFSFADTKYKESDYESKIHKDILKGYEKDVHPVMEENSARVIFVTFDVQLIRILEIVRIKLLIEICKAAGTRKFFLTKSVTLLQAQVVQMFVAQHFSSKQTLQVTKQKFK